MRMIEFCGTQMFDETSNVGIICAAFVVSDSDRQIGESTFAIIEQNQPIFRGQIFKDRIHEELQKIYPFLDPVLQIDPIFRQTR